jgi:hypothetical protein
LCFLFLSVLIPLANIVLRLRHSRSRADEVVAVRERLARVPGPRDAGEDEVALAERLRALRTELADAFGDVSSCGGCARGRPLPHGRFRGGFCCGGKTEEIFTDDELAALRLSGTTPARLAPPQGDHAGCAFRGEHACSLAPEHRPNLCVRFVCRELEAELRARGDLARVKAIARELGDTFSRFSSVRRDRAEATDSGEP